MISGRPSDSLLPSEIPCSYREPNMQRPRLLLAVSALVALLGGAPTVSAHTLVDPTTLTPPLKPFRVCYEDGQWVKCDTSSVATIANEPSKELSCGTLYLTGTETLRATRWYNLDLLLVERAVQDDFRGSWSRSPDGSGPTVDIAANFSWRENFVVPGDLDSIVEVSHGSFVRVAGLGAIGMDAGTFKGDGTFLGHAGEDIPVEDPALCRLLDA